MYYALTKIFYKPESGYNRIKKKAVMVSLPFLILDKIIVFSEGGDLLFHTVTHAVPSALVSLTSVFGMGTGVPLSQLPPSLNTTILKFMCDRGIINIKAIDILVSLG